MLKPMAENRSQPNRMYEFSHDAGRPSWSVESSRFSMLISYPMADNNMKDIIEGERLSFIGLKNGLDVNHDFYPYTVSSRFRIGMENGPEEIVIKLEFDRPVKAGNDESGIIVVRDIDEIDLITIVPSKPKDDTDMAGPAPKIEISGSGNTWELSLSIDEIWTSDMSRVFPLTMMLDYSITPAMGIQAAAVRAFALEDETVLYRDTRPDAATQFNIALFDDPEFRRERLRYEGSQTCSTVPLGIGDTSDLTEADIERYDNGLGYDSRTVWARFIASKEIPSSVQVTYNVYTPGTIDYLNNVAEQVGSLGGLPIYRGSFVVHQQSPPGHQDGIGTIEVYIDETRNKEINASLTVKGASSSDLPCRIMVTDGKRGMANLGCSLTVIRKFSNIPATVTVLPSELGNRGLQSIPAAIIVNQYQAAGEVLYDSGFDEPSGFITYWTETPYATAQKISGSYPSECYSEPSSIAHKDSTALATSITIDDVGEATSYGLNVYLEPATIIRTGNVFNTSIPDGALITVRYKHSNIAPPDDWEWYPTTNDNTAILKITAIFGGLGDGSGTYTNSTIWAGNAYGTPIGTLRYLHGVDNDWHQIGFCISAASLAADDVSTVYLDSIGVYWVSRWSYQKKLSHPYNISSTKTQSSMLIIDDVSVTTGATLEAPPD